MKVKDGGVEHVHQAEGFLWIQTALQERHGGRIFLQAPDRHKPDDLLLSKAQTPLAFLSITTNFPSFFIFTVNYSHTKSSGRLLEDSPCGGNLDHNFRSFKTDLRGVSFLILDLSRVNHHLRTHTHKV